MSTDCAGMCIDRVWMRTARAPSAFALFRRYSGQTILPYFLFPITYFLFPIPYFLFPIPYSLFPIPYFLFPITYFLFPIPTCHSCSFGAKDEFDVPALAFNAHVNVTKKMEHEHK